MLYGYLCTGGSTESHLFNTENCQNNSQMFYASLATHTASSSTVFCDINLCLCPV